MIKIFDARKFSVDSLVKKLIRKTHEIENKLIVQTRGIIDDVKQRGDKALCEYIRKFEGVVLSPETLKIDEKEIKESYGKVDKELINSLKVAMKRIEDFHSMQRQNSWFTIDEKNGIMGQMVIPMKNVGIYVPGGRAVYPSTLLMNAIPAKIAKVENIIISSPVQRSGKIHPCILLTADLLGIHEIYKMGGAQAIAALSYGTETVPKVDKIVGPGNIYVAIAKKLVFGDVGIDSIAGPSEILIIADDSARADFVASDLLSQAEHDVMARAILVTTSAILADSVRKALSKFTMKLSRKEIIRKSLENYGAIIIARDLNEAFHISNEIAPEHLELMIKEPFLHLSTVKNAGTVFIGDYSPEAIGDYLAGPNHVLPTGGTCRFFSPLGVQDFLKRTNFVYYTESGLENSIRHIKNLTKIEGLHAHALAVEIRKDKKRSGYEK